MEPTATPGEDSDQETQDDSTLESSEAEGGFEEDGTDIPRKTAVSVILHGPETDRGNGVQASRASAQSIAPLLALPMELLSEIFAQYLIVSKFKGWTTLLLQSRPC